MRLDSVERLIEAADFSTFRELVLEYLQFRRYEPVVTDGWRDGGRDFALFQLPPERSVVGVQATVERNWKRKLRQDARKAKGELDVRHLLFFSSRRIPEAEFEEVARELFREGVTVLRTDRQGLASAYVSEHRVNALLDLFGIPADRGPGTSPVAEEDFRADVAYAYLLFAPEVAEFRNGVVEQAIAVVLRGAQAMDREAVVDVVVRRLGLQETAASLVQGAIDRMLQRGAILGGATIELHAHTRADLAAVERLRRSHLTALRHDVTDLLKGSIPEDMLDPTVGHIVEDLGALAVSTGVGTAEVLSRAQSRYKFLNSLRDRIRHLHAALDTAGFQGDRFVLTKRLAALVGSSPLGATLVAGEMFVALARLEVPQFVRAFGGRTDVVLWLDASVAIPMLTSALFGISEQQYVQAAAHAFSQARAHGLTFTLPRDYLEEAASHLLDAYHYSRIVDDPDLRVSTNAYVAHYASLAYDGASPDEFSDYLGMLGLDEPAANEDFYTARDIAMNRLQRLFDRNGIQVKTIRKPSNAGLLQADTHLAHGLRELEITRPEILLKHDRWVVASLNDSDRDSAVAHVLCTNDNLHFYVRDHMDVYWSALDPAMLGDALVLVAPEGRSGEPVTPLVLVASLSEEQAAAGAAVWDTIVRSERTRLSEAHLLSMAREFKENYLRSGAASRREADIRRAWLEWKQKA